MEKLLVLSLVLSVYGLECPGKLTGFPCLSPKDVVREYQPTIDSLKAKISTVYKSTGDSLISTRMLIQSNIADAKNLTNRSLLKMRTFLNEANIEASRANPRIRTCISGQSIELSKIRPGIFTSCNGNFTTLLNSRRQILLLEKLSIELVSFCSRLNPLSNEVANFKMCLERKMNELQLQLVILEQNFTRGIKEVVSFSTNCVMRESARVHEKIGAIEGGVRNCRNVGVF